jgi:hypothetical protein
MKSGIFIKDSDFSEYGWCTLDISNSSIEEVVFEDFVGVAFVNLYLQFPLIRGRTITRDLKTINFPENITLRTGDEVHVYIWKKKPTLTLF